MAKLLLVEDDNNLREIYQARLAAEGYEIVSAQDGEEALVVAKQQKPDLVISDVMMPKISGFEMLDILRNTPGLENVRVIMLTALSQGEDRQRADSLGADKYLVKSQVTLEDIVKTARALLEGEEGTDENAAATLAAASAAAAPAAEATPETEPAPAPEAAAPVIPVAEEPVAAPEEAPASAAPTADAATPAPAMPVAQPPADDDTASEADESAANALVDDKLVVDAVNELTKGDATKPDDTPAPAAADADTEVETKAATGGNRVIQPITGEKKPSLDELVAKEEAAEAAAKPTEPATETPAEAETPETEPAPAPQPEAEKPAPAEEKKSGGIDPNSVAL